MAVNYTCFLALFASHCVIGMHDIRCQRVRVYNVWKLLEFKLHVTVDG